MSRNEELWHEIYELEPFANKPDKNDRGNARKHYNQAWGWAEKLERGGRLRALDLIQLKGLLDNVYALGVHDGASNPYC